MWCLGEIGLVCRGKLRDLGGGRGERKRDFERDFVEEGNGGEEMEGVASTEQSTALLWGFVFPFFNTFITSGPGFFQVYFEE